MKEVELLEKDGAVVDFNIMIRKNPKGLGDSIENFTTTTGIKSMVDRVSKGLNIPCGCEARRDALNKIVPYKMKRNK